MAMLRSILRACLLCLAVAACFHAAPAAAAPHVDWRTSGCYFDDAGKPVIVGHFVNDGSETVTVTRLRIHVYLQKGTGDPVLIAAGAWDGIDAVLRPGERSRTVRLRFADYDGQRRSFDRCLTRGDVTYRLIRGAEA
jgi:hypothetical protein